MFETYPRLLPMSKMELSVTIINGSPIYVKSSVLARTLPHLSCTFIYHLYYPYYCCPVKSPASVAILHCLLYLFASKSGRISTRNSIDSFLISSSSVVCFEFNHSPLTSVRSFRKGRNSSGKFQ